MRAPVAIMLLSMIAITVAIVGAAEMPKFWDPCVWVRLHLCKHLSGDEVELFNIQGFQTQAHEYRRISNIIGVIPIATTNECVILIMANGKTVAAHVSLDEARQRLDPEACKGRSHE